MLDPRNRLRLKILIDSIVKNHCLTEYSFKTDVQWYHVTEESVELIIKEILELMESELDKYTG